MKNIYTLSFLIAIFGTNVLAQNPEWINYTNGDDKTALINDDSTLWVGTHGGLVKIDEPTSQTIFYNHANSGLPDNFVKSIALDINHDIWIVAGNNLAQFDGSVFTTYNSNNSPLKSTITAITIDSNGNKWVAVPDTLFKFDGLQWTYYEQMNSGWSYSSVSRMAVDGNQNIWGISTIVSQYPSLVRFNGTASDEFNNNNSTLPWADYTSIAIDSSNNIWLGGSLYGLGVLVAFDGVNSQIFDNTNSGLYCGYVHSILIDEQETKYIATSFGLYQCENSVITLVYGIPYGFVHVAKSYDGTYWLSGGTLINYDGISVVTFNTSNSGLFNNSVPKIFISSDDKKWITNMISITSFYNQQWDSVYSPAHILSIDGNNHLWCTSFSGLVEFNTVTGTPTIYDTLNSNIPSEKFRSILVDSVNHIWLDCYKYILFPNFSKVYYGLTTFDGSNFTTYNTSNSAIPEDSIRLLAIDKQNNIWMESNSHGLIKFDGVNFTTFNTEASGVDDQYVLSGGAENDGTLWLATSGYGLLKFDGIDFTLYTPDNSSLPSANVNSVTIDDNNTKWIATSAGLSKFDGLNFTNYHVSNSGLGNEMVNAVTIDVKGNKWIATNGGISVFNESGVQSGMENNSSISNEIMNVFPNPFIQSASINYTLSGKAPVSLEVVNLTGQKVFTILQHEYQSAGKHQYNFSIPNEGMYFLKITVDGKLYSQKIVCVK